MTPAHPTPPPPDPVDQLLRRAAIEAGDAIHAAPVGRRWTLRQLGDAAGMSPSAVQRIESGLRGSLDSYVRLGHALGLRLELVFLDRRRARADAVQADVVHAAMGELEAARLSGFGFRTGIDEPYQHFQFAGRADLIAWDLESKALLHIENRTRFPDIQQASGAWNAKRLYLAPQIGDRVGVAKRSSVTHAMVGLWTREVLDVVRQHRTTFNSLCPDNPSAFDGWWNGRPPAQGLSSAFVLIDPCAAPRRQVGRLEEALTARPRHRGYAEVAQKLRKK